MSQAPTLHVLTPTFRPAGGVVKIFDYVTHAMALGYRVSVWCPEARDEGLPLFDIERFAHLVAGEADIEFHARDRLAIGARDLVFLSLPQNFEPAYRSLPVGMSPERIIHIIQNVRHVTPTWGQGYPLRLLTRPAARISINDIVARTVAPWLDERAFHRIIPIGHQLGYFRLTRQDGFSRPLRVAHTSWKSDLGFRVEAAAQDDPFEFRAISHSASWAELRELYQWADVFLCSPGPEEGFYLPGLEAMEAGCVVVTPDVGGNMAYCRPGENCVLVGFEDAEQSLEALREIARWSVEQTRLVRHSAQATVEPFDLAKERVHFGTFLDDLWARIELFESDAQPRVDTTQTKSPSPSTAVSSAASPAEASART